MIDMTCVSKIHLYMSIGIYPSLYIYLTVYVCMSIYLFMYVFLFIYLCFYVCLHIYVSVCLYVYLSVSVYVCMYVAYESLQMRAPVAEPVVWSWRSSGAPRWSSYEWPQWDGRWELPCGISSRDRRCYQSNHFTISLCVWLTDKPRKSSSFACWLGRLFLISTALLNMFSYIKLKQPYS